MVGPLISVQWWRREGHPVGGCVDEEGGHAGASADPSPAICVPPNLPPPLIAGRRLLPRYYPGPIPWRAFNWPPLSSYVRLLRAAGVESVDSGTGGFEGNRPMLG